VLVLDEPTAGLDPRQIIDIRGVIKDLAAEHTVLLSTHILPEVAMMCERVIIINEGRIIAQDTMANLAGSGRDKRLFEAEILGEDAAIMKCLQETRGVLSVEAAPDGKYRIATEQESRTGAAMTAALNKAGHGVNSLHETKRTLEDVFIEAISADEGARA